MAGKPMEPVSTWKLLVALVLLLVVLALISLKVAAPLGSCAATVHIGTQLAGSTDRLAKQLQRQGCISASNHDLHASLRVDFGLAMAYAVGLAYYLRFSWRGWLIDRLNGLQMAWVLPLGAGAMDIVENVLSWLGVHDSASGLSFRSDRWAVAISTAAWSKWLLLVATALAILTSTWATLSHRPSVGPAPAPEDEPLGGVGVCCSGGGIRAAGFNLGALLSLEQRGILAEARWLSAVSGGAYTAGAYATGRAATPRVLLPELRARLVGDPYPPSPKPDPTATSPRPYHPYLARGPGGLPRSVLWMLGCILCNAAAVTAGVITAAWPVGVLYRTWVFRDSFPSYSVKRAWRWPAAHQWEGGLVLLGLAVLVLLGWIIIRAIQKGDSSLLGPGALMAGALAALGIGQVAVLLVAPMLFQLDGWFLQLATQVTSTLVFGFSLATIAGVVWKYTSKRVLKLAPRLGGVLLLVLLLWLGAYVANCQIRARGFFHSMWVVIPISAGFLLVF